MYIIFYKEASTFTLAEPNSVFVLIFKKLKCLDVFLFLKKYYFYLYACIMLNIFLFLFKTLIGIIILFIGLIPWGKFRPGH